MEEKSNTSSEKDFVFTKRQVSFMYEYWYENNLIDDCANEMGINEVAEKILEECMQSEDNEGVIIDLEAMQIPTNGQEDEIYDDSFRVVGMDMKYCIGTTTASVNIVLKRIFETVDSWL